MHHDTNKLKVKIVGIDTYKENIIYMRSDCHICTAEGFKALTRLQVSANGQSIVATLNVVQNGLLAEDEAGLSTESVRRLNVHDGNEISIHHLPPVTSMAHVRSKMFGNPFTDAQLLEIMEDVVAGRYSNTELAAFVTACSGDNLSLEEITGLTKAMIAMGKRLTWDNTLVLDKHCIGGLPGNRTTPIVVSIIAAAGYTIPKTSSRAITSPAGTADTMETITNVTLTYQQLRDVVTKENGCLAWGGAVELSPADDVIISVERTLDVDSEGQMIASVLSKKAAAGATHIVIDIPMGPTAKVRTTHDAERIAHYFKTVGSEVGLTIETIITDGSQPVGVGIGPTLEAMDVLAVLQNRPDAPDDLKEHALALAGKLLEMIPDNAGHGTPLASRILEDGTAYERFKEICEAQGAWKTPAYAAFSFNVTAQVEGTITAVNNRQLAKLAKLAGAPKSPSAGLQFFARLGKSVRIGDTLLRIWAETRGELDYAIEYLKSVPQIITITA